MAYLYLGVPPLPYFYFIDVVQSSRPSGSESSNDAAFWNHDDIDDRWRLNSTTLRPSPSAERCCAALCSVLIQSKVFAARAGEWIRLSGSEWFRA